MAIPVYVYLYDERERLIEGGVNAGSRKNSIEVLELMHGIELPVDDVTGKITGKRIHSSYAFEKEIDISTPYLYRALTTGRSLCRAEFNFYKINHNGVEELYFKTILENVKVVGIEPLLMDVKSSTFVMHNHHEYIDLRYEKITWHYVDGNVCFSDSWIERG